MSNLRLFASALSLSAGLALIVPASAAPAGGLTMSTDEVRVLSFPSPVKTVFVGNPTIADVTVIEFHTCICPRQELRNYQSRGAR